jgi:2-iminobutanoate/2-iminopropanoate deaminase
MSTDADLIWVAATVDDGAADSLATTLGARGLTLDDVVHLKVWAPTTADGTAAVERLLGAFQDPAHRPSVSVIPSHLQPGTACEITAIALRGVRPRSVYEPHQGENEFPSASVAGDFLSIATLGADPAQSGDPSPEAQAEACFERLHAILQQVGARPDGVGHMFVWYRDHAVREVVNGPFLKLFPTPGDRPARHSLVRALDEGVALQIEAMGSITARRNSYTVSGVWHGGIQGVPNSLPFGTKTGSVLFSAGTYGRNPDTDEIPDDLEGQQAFAVVHSRSLLEAAGMPVTSVRHVYVWLRDLGPADRIRAELVHDLLDGADDVPIQFIESPLPGTNQIQIELVAVDATPGGQ